MSRVALYTANVGRYESIADVLDPSVASNLGDAVRLYRFTDSVHEGVFDWDAQSARWENVELRLRLPDDAIRSARYIKIIGPRELSHHEITMWVDNRVRLTESPAKIVERFLPDDADIALPLHSYHPSLLAEFEAVHDGRFDDPRRVREQWDAYSRQFPHLLTQPVYWTAILIRRNNDAVRRFNHYWWEQVLRYSRRDQLSFPYACHAVPNLRVAPFIADNFQSDFHEWQKMSEVGRPQGAGHWEPTSLRAELRDSVRFVQERMRQANIVTRWNQRWSGRAIQ